MTNKSNMIGLEMYKNCIPVSLLSWLILNVFLHIFSLPPSVSTRGHRIIRGFFFIVGLVDTVVVATFFRHSHYYLEEKKNFKYIGQYSEEK